MKQSCPESSLFNLSYHLVSIDGKTVEGAVRRLGWGGVDENGANFGRSRRCAESRRKQTMNGETSRRLNAEFGDIDIYVFDQLLRGRIEHGMRILDAGCGGGRNVFYLMRNAFDVWGVDESPDAVAAIRRQAATIAPALDEDRFGVQSIEALRFDDAAFDVVICGSVLHFAKGEPHWRAMVRQLWRVLKPGGMLFTRLASTIGHESGVKPLGGRRYVMPDGNERFLVDEAFLMTATAELGGKLLDPLKTTVVQGTRSMTTWVVGKA